MKYLRTTAILLVFLIIAESTFGAGTAFGTTAAIMDFQNSSGEKEIRAVGPIITVILTSDMTNTGTITIVERDELNKVMSEYSLSYSAMVDDKTAKEAGKLLGAEYLITGAYSKLGPGVRIDAKVIDVGSGIVTAFSQSGRDENTVHRLAKEITKFLTGREFSSFEVESPLRLYTESAINQILQPEKPWYKRWSTWVIVLGIVAGGAAIAAGAGGGEGGAGGGGGGGAGGAAVIFSH